MGQTIGDRIRESRVKAGLAQTDLAAATGVRLQTISMWERGKTVPRVNQVERMAEALGVRVAWLVTGEAA